MDDGPDTQVYDAGGNLISFLMVIAATFQVEGGDTANVHMHIQRSDGDIILIGNNALKSLGIRIQVEAKVKHDSGRAVEGSASFSCSSFHTNLTLELVGSCSGLASARTPLPTFCNIHSCRGRFVDPPSSQDASSRRSS
ncbi:hypothetical protein Aduo_008412 [Ancylostoma duodenale]